jgi:FkbM family methyltransferase
VSVLSSFYRRLTKVAQRSEPFALGDLRRQPRGLNEAAIRQRCVSAYLGDGRALTRVLGRYKMVLDTRDLDLCAHLLLDGYWEMWVTELFPSLLRPGMVCADIGAHVGYYSLLMADLVGPEGMVHAFEPNPDTRALLDLSSRINGFSGVICSHGHPVHDRNGVPALLHVPDGQPSGAHLGLLPEGDQGADTLRTIRLDAVPGLDRVDFLKIDAEGSEEAIWRGMRGIFDQGRPMTIVMEFTLGHYPSPRAFLAAMAQEGFAIRRIDPESGLVTATVEDILGGGPVVNQMLVLTR